MSGGIVVTIAEGYLGECAQRNCRKDAKHKVWCEFDNPIPAYSAGGIDFPKVCGVFEFVCDEHLT